jgi:hypothetical protein
MKTFTKLLVVMGFMWLFMAPGSALAAESGGGSGCGDIFGDLIHIKRDAVTGQPILQKRWIEYPQDLFDWGYCPIPVDINGEEIPFVDLTCDPVDTEAVVEVDYFGRLSGGRTKERVNRMHFDEVINNIKDAGKIKVDAAGRLMLGFDCFTSSNNNLVCPTWKTIDSPMENLALYLRLMKYGHLQTDPMEVDIWAAGDPAAGIQYHPALGPEDWGKVGRAFLPSVAGGQPENCFHSDNSFNPDCALPETLMPLDYRRAASFLAAAADKTGKITVDLVQYMNRILKITLDTETTLANVDQLPALIRDCGDDPEAQLPYEECVIVPATEGMAAPADEMFVDFKLAAYNRFSTFDKTLNVIMPLGDGTWVEQSDIELLDWLEFANGPAVNRNSWNIGSFVDATSDALRTVEFLHNYEIPADLGWDFE